MSGMGLATFSVGADCWGGSTFTCNRSLPYSTTLNRNNPCSCGGTCAGNGTNVSWDGNYTLSVGGAFIYTFNDNGVMTSAWNMWGGMFTPDGIMNYASVANW